MMLRARDLRNESLDELNLKLLALKNEVLQLRSQRLDSKTQKTHLIGQKRKEIARILTVMKEYELRGNHG
jgi:large subunit ribosomal protein L29